MSLPETLRKLKAMHLGTMADTVQGQFDDPNFRSLPFEDRLAIIVDAEYSARKNNKLKKLLKDAGYPVSASTEEILYAPDRQLDRETVLRLSTCSYINDHRNVVILGATGTGKTYLACALGNSANRNYLAVKYIRLPELLVEMQAARMTGTYKELMREYSKFKLLILDEWLLYPLTEVEARDVLEMIESRLNRSSTIFCSQFDVPEWHKSLYDPTMADAICDRIVYNSYRIVIKGDSMRRMNAVAD